MEQIRVEFIEYLRNKYQNNFNDLKSKWEKEDISDWNDIRFPTKTGKYFQDGNDTQKEDIKSFWEQHKNLESKIIDEEVNNE